MEKGGLWRQETASWGLVFLGQGSEEHCSGLCLQQGMTRWCHAHSQRPHTPWEPQFCCEALLNKLHVL